MCLLLGAGVLLYRYTHRLFLHAHRLYLPLKRKPELCVETPDPFADSSVLSKPPQ
jgi:hypothetical protein